MITRIIHLSDLHFPSRDAGVQRILADEIIQKQPDVLVVTGDLVNHAPIFRAGRWREVCAWLAQLEADVTRVTERELAIHVLPGNHDVLFSGLFGWCFLPTWAFRRAFRRWQAPAVSYDEASRITFLTLDTNPRGAFWNAKGKALGGRLKRLKKDLDAHPQATQIRSSTKILLMHHHPLPVPHRGPDWLLETRRVDKLLSFVAENRIDLILHGHKHHATWSHLRIGGTSDALFFVEVLGAGAAFKRTDYDPRGHNFNLLDVGINGVRRVRQFFKDPGAAYFAESPSNGAEERISRMVASHFRQPYRFTRLAWTLEVDEEGDTRNELRYTGLIFNETSGEPRLPLPEDEIEIGQHLDYRLIAPGSGAAIGVDEATKGAYVSFTVAPAEPQPAEVAVENYWLSCYVMNRAEAEQWGLQDRERENVEYLLRDVVEELRFEIRFPASFRFQDQRVEVLEPTDGTASIHRSLTQMFSPAAECDPATPNRLTVTLRTPPANLSYRVSWRLPDAPSPHLVARARRSCFERFYLSLRDGAPGPGKDAAREAIVTLFMHAWHTLGQQFAARQLPELHPDDAAALDVSVMVCDRENAPPALRMVYWSGERENPEYFRKCQLQIGQGNAGRAYKSCALRIYDVEKAARDPKANTYVQLEGSPKHLALLSIPLFDPIHRIPLAVVNLGTTSRQHAESLVALNPEHLQALATAIHREPLTHLLRAANLDQVSQVTGNGHGNQTPQN